MALVHNVSCRGSNLLRSIQYCWYLVSIQFLLRSNKYEAIILHCLLTICLSRHLQTITGSLTPNRSDGSRFSYSTAWGALPECAAQQVCSALYVRLNRTQPLCQCSSGQFKEPCSTTDYVDEHSIKLISSSDKKKVRCVSVITAVPILRMRCTHYEIMVSVQIRKVLTVHYFP